MRECPACFNCYDDSVLACPEDGRSTFNSLPGDVVLERKYVLERRLGEGGMGIVYKAHHKFLKTTRAIKIIKPELVGNDPSFATRFQQEAIAAAAIGHPNIISVPDYGFLEEKIPFLVMEFVEGISLQDLMTREGRFSPERALEFFQVIGSGVGAAHAHGIVHRDLKPLNIMLHRNGAVREQIRILDFGLAKIKSAELFGSFVGAKTTGIIGSPYYMAPEQWSDEETDKRCDIYSLGIILHQMLAGDVPFKGSSIPAIMKKHLMTPAPPLALTGTGISEQLEKVVHHALEKDPKLRTASVEELISELEQAVSGKTARVKPKPRPGKKGRKVAPATDGNKTDSLSPAKTTSPEVEVAAAAVKLAGENDVVPAQDLNTIIQPPPTAYSELEVEFTPSGRRSIPEPEDERLRKATEDARQRAMQRALREVEESGAQAVAASNSSARHLMPSGARSLPPDSPGWTTRFLRKQVVLPVAAVVVLGVVGLLIAVNFPPKNSNNNQVEIPTPTPQPPLTLRDMALIEGGTFTMGSDRAGKEQRGEHQVRVGSFYLDTREVTNAQYAEFIKATGHPAPTIDASDSEALRGYWKAWVGTDPPEGREHWPVANITAKDAEAFAQWRSARDGIQYRLPSEQEWEFAARNGPKSTLFPWGDTWSPNRANLNNSAGPKNVGSFPDGATQHGVLDLIGNVWEWTSSTARYYDGSPQSSEPLSSDELKARVWRGGSFAEKIQTDFYNATDRGWGGDEHFKAPAIGFRLARNAQ